MIVNGIFQYVAWVVNYTIEQFVSCFHIPWESLSSMIPTMAGSMTPRGKEYFSPWAQNVLQTNAQSLWNGFMGRGPYLVSDVLMISILKLAFKQGVG